VTARRPDNFIDHFVSVVLGHIEREYPGKMDHVMNDSCEVKGPRELHPVFYGSFDWHSSVHGHWLLARALRSYQGIRQVDEVTALMDRHFSPENIDIEVRYLKQPLRETFERTYGWAWLLKLAAELRLGTRELGASSELGAAFARWDRTLDPLAQAFVRMYLKYLPKATYPIRVGTHTNSAFGLALALDYARVLEHGALAELVKGKARAWYSKDMNCPAWEPDGTDFLSPALMEAECMRRALDGAEFVAWLDKFLPNLAKKEPATLFTPAFVSDRTDGQITHLDGLNLSRAWCWRTIARALPEGDPRRTLAEQTCGEHLDAALPHVTGDYMGEHWLATFALLAMTE
jgi:hypothetical protein